MTENNQVAESPINEGVALLPKTDKRPLAIVGMNGITEEINTLSERLTQVGMEHVVLTVEEVEKEGITRADLEQVQQEQKDNLEKHQTMEQMQNMRTFDANTNYAPSRRKKGGGSKAQQKFVRKKKGKKTHRKKRKK